MRFYPQDRLALFVDGTNIYYAAKALNFDIDYAALLSYYADKATLVRAAYYTRLYDTQEFNRLRPLVDWLDYNGWQVVTRDKDTDVDLAVGMMELADSVDHFILASGDSDYCAVVDALQRRGKLVTVLSTIKTTPHQCHDDLRRSADQFQDLADIKNGISRPVPARAEALRA